MAFIKLDRKFFEGRYWNQERAFSLAEAWLDLLQLARFEADAKTKTLKSGRVVTIHRGELHASLRYLSQRWNWSIAKVKRFIDKAEKNKDIKRRTEHSESILTLCKYEDYNPLINNDRYTGRNSSETPSYTPSSTNIKNRRSKEKEEKTSKKNFEEGACFFLEGENPKDRERTAKTESSSQDADILEIANAEPLEKLEELVGYLKRRFHLKNDTDIKGFVCSHARQDKEFYERFKHSVKEFFTYHDTVKTKTRYVMNWSSFKEKWDLEDYGKKLEEHQRSTPVQTKQEMIYHATML